MFHVLSFIYCVLYVILYIILFHVILSNFLLCDEIVFVDYFRSFFPCSEGVDVHLHPPTVVSALSMPLSLLPLLEVTHPIAPHIISSHLHPLPNSHFLTSAYLLTFSSDILPS